MQTKSRQTQKDQEESTIGNRGQSAALAEFDAALLCSDLREMRQLLDSPITADELTQNGQTWLRMAVCKGRTDSAQLLLDCGVDVNERDLKLGISVLQGPAVP